MNQTEYDYRRNVTLVEVFNQMQDNPNLPVSVDGIGESRGWEKQDSYSVCEDIKMSGLATGYGFTLVILTIQGILHAEQLIERGGGNEILTERKTVRNKILRKVYEKTGDNPHAKHNLKALSEEMGFSGIQLEHAHRYLTETGLLTVAGGGYHVVITPQGWSAAENTAL